jgi:proline dehydrogenase
MRLARKALLALSAHRGLTTWATHSKVVRRSVRRFMPGERLDDALAAARVLRSGRMGVILTELGENLTTPDEARAVTARYAAAIDRIASEGLDAYVSVKPTQLGLDLDRPLCEAQVVQLADRAAASGRSLWIDMEGSQYVDHTLALVTAVRQRALPVGVAVQAYLYRSAADVETLAPAGVAIRLVKGAYLEPPSVAMPRKRDVDENYFTLATRLLSSSARTGGPTIHLATHDRVLIERLEAFIRTEHIPDSVYEYAMLYGIQTTLQQRLAADGRRMRVLISYGANWFPWYMRRLAERPANVWFVARNLMGS